jgi:hypothetical protein
MSDYAEFLEKRIIELEADQPSKDVTWLLDALEEILRREKIHHNARQQEQQ